MNKSELQIIIPNLQDRISNIEKEEYFASKKMYDHSRGVLGFLFLLITVITILIPIFIFFVQKANTDNIGNFLNRARTEFKEITGNLKTAGYRVKISSPNNSGGMNLFLHELTEKKSTENVNYLTHNRNIIAHLEGGLEYFGGGSEFAKINGTSSIIIWNDKLFEIMKNDTSKPEYTKFKIARRFRGDISGLINENISVPSTFRIRLNLNCIQLQKLINAVNKNEITGTIKHIPIIENHNGIIAESTTTFSVSSAISNYRCPSKKNDSKQKDKSQ